MRAAYEHCDVFLKAQDPDRWLACLFIPANFRPHVHALYAFSAEIARVREAVHEALPGEIRLQYWRDVLESGTAENPVAIALLDTVAKFKLPKASLQNLIDARVFDLYDDAFPTQNDLEGYCGETCSALFQLTALILGVEQAADAAGHAGVAYAMAGLMLALPFHTANGQCFLPEEHLEKHGLVRDDIAKPESLPKLKAVLRDMAALAESHLAKAESAIKLLPAAAKPAFLPLSLVRRNLTTVVLNPNPARIVMTPAPWRKPLSLWWASFKT